MAREPPLPIPGVVGSVPVAGFEIESSWRTRKHLEGDLLNLQDAGVALGVIVLAGADARDDSLRRFAESLVDRPGAQILVWTHDDVRALGAGEVAVTEVEAAASEVASRAEPNGADHAGKYRPLWEWLRQQDRREIRISFADLEDQAGISLPDSCRAHLAHWYGYQGSAVARAIIDAGWHAAQVRLGLRRSPCCPVFGADPVASERLPNQSRSGMHAATQTKVYHCLHPRGEEVPVCDSASKMRILNSSTWTARSITHVWDRSSRNG